MKGLILKHVYTQLFAYIVYTVGTIAFVCDTVF